jgi:hypothetical protein
MIIDFCEEEVNHETEIQVGKMPDEMSGRKY